MSARDRLTDRNRLGVWYFTDAMAAGAAAETAARIESLGYSTLWVPETLGRDPFAHLAWLGSQTTTLQLATGIAGIFNRQPGSMVQAANTVNEQTNGRLVLGLGVSHSPMVEGVRGLDYSKPLSKMREYLAAMDAAASMYMAVPPAEPTPRLLAALGPKMLELSAAAADGAHPYFTTPEHTAEARATIGPDKLLCVEQKVILSTDADAARAAAIAQIGIYANLPNYRNNWKRLGFTEDEIEQRAHRFVDHVVVWGDEDRVRAGIEAHFDAGADHVCIQPVSTEGRLTLDWNVLETLAPSA
jgi:probable F420-dependent oxidoreductase